MTPSRPSAAEPPLHQLTLEVPVDQAEALAERAQAAGLHPVLLEKPRSPLAWVEFYLANAEEASRLGRAFSRALPGLRWSAQSLGRRDWSTFWRHHFKPHPVGERIWVRPLWSRRRAPAGRDVTLVVNPGLSFGTGDHFTTRFCLEALDRLARTARPRRMLDAGCGSAILALAAVKLGAGRALAVDHDPLALESARENVALNGETERVTLRQVDLLADWPRGVFDLVCANLYGEMLLRLAPRLVASTRRHLVLSGIRAVELDGVEQTYVNHGLRVLRSDCDAEWGGLILERERRAKG
jgi:ribosomal protein L11 methyltransferase